jgi:alginate O-acetyltransferase complex protein AlgI
MVFSSLIFLFFFLPLVLLLHFALPGRWRNGLLLIASIVFYGWGEVRFLWVMFTSSVLDYFAGLVIGKEYERLAAQGVTARKKTGLQKLALAVSLAGNLGLLGFFKYAGFFVENIHALLVQLGLGDLMPCSTLKIALPLGISFYTFQSLSYTVDVYRGSVRYTRNMTDFLCFVTLFPQLVAGPIVRYRDIAAEIVQRNLSLAKFSEGVRLFIIGLAKKMLVANTVAAPADAIFALPTDELSTGMAWLGTFCFTMQLYFDFAGYSDMALGLGRMLGFTFPGNFNYPYISRTMAEFWQRWHITLSTWLRDYVFTPLGGYRNSRARSYANVLITFLLCGFWHGAAWNFVIFGGICGSCIVFERIIHANRIAFFKGHLARLFYMLPLIFFNMAMFRSDSAGAAFMHWKAMLGLSRHVNPLHQAGFLLNGELVFVLIAAATGCAPFIPWIKGRLTGLPRIRAVLEYVCLVALFVLCAMKLAAGTYNPFIYFRF